MVDILDAAQTTTPAPPASPNRGEPVGGQPPVPPVVEPVPPVTEPVPAVPMEPSPPPATEPTTSSDSLIVPPPEAPAPPPEEPKQEEVMPPEKPKKKSRLGVLLAGLLLLVITLPILVVYVRQQIEIRSRAATINYYCYSTPDMCANAGGTSVAKSYCTNCTTTCCKVTIGATPTPTSSQMPCNYCSGVPAICTASVLPGCSHSADTCTNLGSLCGPTPTPTPTQICEPLGCKAVASRACCTGMLATTDSACASGQRCYYLATPTPAPPTVRCCCAGGAGGGACTLVSVTSCPSNLPVEAATILACSPSTGTIKCCCAGGGGAVASCAWVSGSCPANMPVTAATTAPCSGSTIITPVPTSGTITYDPACSTLGSGWASAGSNRDAAEEICIAACDNTTQSASHPNCINATIQRPTPMGTVPNYCYKCTGVGGCGACNQNMAASCNIVAGQCIRNGWNGCASCFIDCDLPGGCGGVTPPPTTPPPTTPPPAGVQMFVCRTDTHSCIGTTNLYTDVNTCAANVRQYVTYPNTGACWASESACQSACQAGNQMYYCNTATRLCQGTTNLYTDVSTCQTNLRLYVTVPNTGNCYTSQSNCQSVCNPSITITPSITPPTCVANGGSCRADSDCCSNDCNNSYTCGAPQCIAIVVYKNGNALSASELSALKPGDTITLAFAPFAPGGAATKVHFRVNAGQWMETSTKNTAGQFILNYTLLPNITSYTIEAEWFDGSAWH